jgi:hypothetical protein
VTLRLQEIPEGIAPMEPQPLEEVVRNVDMRLTRVEQILPTLATKEDLRVAIAEAIAPLATKVELQEAIAPLATKVELQEVRSELREEMRHEGERTRRHFDVVAERLEGHIRLIAEGQVLLQERFEDLRTDLKADIAQLDRRVMRLEAAR